MQFWKPTLALIVTLFFLTTTGFAKSVTLGETGSVTVDGVEYTLFPTQPGANCLCELLTMRALQAVDQYLSLPGGLVSADTTIVTGWKSDGPERIFTQTMPWVLGENFFRADTPTHPKFMTLDDAWFAFTIDGVTHTVQALADNFMFRPKFSHPGYQAGWNFFDYRTLASDDVTKAYFRSIARAQVMENFQDGAAFEVTTSAVPEPGSALILGLGLSSMALISRRRDSRS